VLIIDTDDNISKDECCYNLFLILDHLGSCVLGKCAVCSGI
jgi:hypothetical protein